MKRTAILAAAISVTLQTWAGDYMFRLKNVLGIDRADETVEVEAKGVTDLAHSCLTDEDGQVIPFEAVDGKIVRFQASVPHGATKGYILSSGTPATPEKLTYATIKQPASRADIVWENDRCAYRMYSSVLLSKEPNTGNGVDLWVKKQPANVIDAMYGLSNYHNESQYGVDAFSVNGRRLGAGGVSHVVNGKLLVHDPYSSCQIVENGRLQSEFVLTYNNIIVNGEVYTKTVRITTSAGSLLNKAVVRYEGKVKPMKLAVALYQHTDMSGVKPEGKAFVDGGLAGWAENLSEGSVTSTGARFYQGCYIPGDGTQTEVIDHHLCVTTDYMPGTDLEYYFGGGWNMFPADVFTSDEDWFDALLSFRQQVENPLALTSAMSLPQKDEVIALLNQVNTTWQHRNPTHGNYFWNRAVYHIGNMAAYKVTQDQSYLDYSQAWAQQSNYWGATGTDKSKWQYSTYGEGSNWVLFGDNQVCFQVYADLYNQLGGEEKIARALEVMGYEISTDNVDYLWWVDGLFMVMPIMTKLYHITGDADYLEKMYQYWRWGTDLMCDETGDDATGLYFRDAKYLYPQHTTNTGQKDFWARGDGWMFAAFATVLSELPADNPHRDEYIQYYRRMAASIKACQQDEGYWTRSMLDPSYAPGRETSGTALFCYGYTWGINNGILSDEEYGETVERAWRYLSTIALQPDGTVGYIQPIGEKADPNQTLSSNSYYDFGVGAYLLAAAEMSRYAAGEQTEIPIRIASVSLTDVNQLTLRLNRQAASTAEAEYLFDGTAFTGNIHYDGDRTVTLTFPKPIPYGLHRVEVFGSEHTFIITVPLTANTTIESVTAIGAQSGNPETNVIDNNFGTRWSQEGQGQWLQLDLGSPQPVYAVDLSFYNGNSRIAYFDIQGSTDGEQWDDVLMGMQSSGLTTGLERFSLPETMEVRYIRVVCNGASNTTWNSITEARVRVADLTIYDIELPEMIYADILLPENTPGGNPVIWSSNNTSLMTNTGLVALSDEEQYVTLTATVGDVEVEYPLVLSSRQPERTLQLAYDFEEADVYTEDNQRFLRDYSAHARHGILMGSQCVVDGTLNLTQNASASFSSNGYVLVPDHLLDSLRSYTVVFEATPASLSSQPRFYDFGSASSNSMFLRAGDFAAGFKYNNGTTRLLKAPALQAGQTYHIAVTFDAMSLTTTIYVDGEQVAMSQDIVHEPYELARIAGDRCNYIGRTQWWNTAVKNDNVDYVGTMDNFRLYGIALTLEEIQQLRTGITSPTHLARDSQNGEGRLYDLSGRCVAGKPVQRGIYIQNGKKMIR